MASHHKGKRWVLVAYDVASPKRLRRVHRFLKREGMAVQYSVFLLQAGDAKYQSVIAGLLELICEKEDDLRFYDCKSREHIWLAGRESDFWRMPGKARSKTPEGKTPPTPNPKKPRKQWFWQF